MPNRVAETLAHNLRHLRLARGWSLETLAARAGVSKGIAVALEQRRGNPSLNTLVKLADALGVPVTRLIEAGERGYLLMVPPGGGTVLWRGRLGGAGRLLLGAEGPVELWRWELAPGEARDSEPHAPGTVELAVVEAGVLELTAGDERAAVPAGAAVRFPGDQPHRYAASGDEPLRFTLVVSLPRSFADG